MENWCKQYLNKKGRNPVLSLTLVIVHHDTLPCPLDKQVFSIIDNLHFSEQLFLYHSLYKYPSAKYPYNSVIAPILMLTLPLF